MGGRFIKKSCDGDWIEVGLGRGPLAFYGLLSLAIDALGCGLVNLGYSSST